VTHPYTGHTTGHTIQEWQSVSGCRVLLDLWCVYPLVITIEFGFRGHTDSYRLGIYGGGAFELCLPSLGNYHRRTTLRVVFWAFADRMSRVVPNWWPSATPPCGMVGGARVCEHYTLRTLYHAVGVGGASALRASSHPVYYI
jgi:hypothetical protein